MKKPMNGGKSERLVSHIRNPMPASGKGKSGEKTVAKTKTGVGG